MRSIAQVFVFALFASGGCAAELSITATAPNGVVGATTGGDPAAWADSIREVAAFFGTRLAGKNGEAPR